MTPAWQRILGGVVLVLAVVGGMSLCYVSYTVMRDLWWLHQIRAVTDGPAFTQDLQFLRQWRLMTEQQLKAKPQP